MVALFLTGYFGSACVASICPLLATVLDHLRNSLHRCCLGLFGFQWARCGSNEIFWDSLYVAWHQAVGTFFFDTSCWSDGNCQVSLHRKRCTENYRELQRITEMYRELSFEIHHFTTSSCFPWGFVVVAVTLALSEVSHDAFQIDLGWIELGICS